VIEEKQLFISSVKPFQLMIGKIIGTSLAGMQFLFGLYSFLLMFAASVFLV
jgi:hypothetical protein